MSGALAAMTSGAPGVINLGLPNAAGSGSASWQINSTGSTTIDGGGAADWVAPASAEVAALYQVKVDPTDGAFDSGDDTGTWLDMSGTRAWNVASAAVVTFDVSWREKGTGVVRGTQTGLTVTVT